VISFCLSNIKLNAMTMHLFANTMEFRQEKVKGSQKDSKQVFEWSSYIDHQNQIYYKFNLMLTCMEYDNPFY